MLLKLRRHFHNTIIQAQFTDERHRGGRAREDAGARMKPSQCHFDRAKIFYPLVVQYSAALIGMKELAGHGVVRRLYRTARKHGISVGEALAKRPYLGVPSAL